MAIYGEFVTCEGCGCWIPRTSAKPAKGGGWISIDYSVPCGCGFKAEVEQLQKRLAVAEADINLRQHQRLCDAHVNSGRCDWCDLLVARLRKAKAELEE